MNPNEIKTFYAEVGRRIKNARVKSNISQEHLAANIGLTRTSITNIEKGRQKLLAHTLWDIANVVAVDVNRLLPSRDEPYKDALKELPESHQKAIKAALEEKGGGPAL